MPNLLARGLLVGAICAASCVWAERSPAAEFVLQSAIFVGSESKPITENRTWFVGHKVYDELLGERPEISVMDLEQQTICLLDLRRRVKTTLSFDDLVQFSAAIKVEALQSSPLARFAAAPEFEVLDQQDEHTLRLKSDWLEYEVQGQTYDSDVIQQYKQFADWFARLNATRVGSLPPHARLELNEQLSRRALVPAAIKLIVRNNKTSQELSSRHELTPSISEEDRLRLEQFDLDCSTFPEIALSAYRQ